MYGNGDFGVGSEVEFCVSGAIRMLDADGAAARQNADREDGK